MATFSSSKTLKKSKLFGDSMIPQNFFLPSSIVYYITMNPSTPKVYNKLIQTCKYFFNQNPMILARHLTEVIFYLNDECFRPVFQWKRIDINKFKNKIWLTNSIHLHHTKNGSNHTKNGSNFIQSRRPKIYRCDISILKIFNGIVDFEDFKFLSESVKHIELDCTTITYANGNPVMLENILEVVPSLEVFNCTFGYNTPMVSAATIKNISKLKNIGCLENLVFKNIPEVFSPRDIYHFLMDRKDVQCDFFFVNNISQEYKNQLRQIYLLIIESRYCNCSITY